MGNIVAPRRALNPDIFKAYLKGKDLSIRTLAKVVDVNEKTIRRAIDDRSITLTVAIELCSYFNDTCTNLFGPDLSSNWFRVINYLK